MSNERKHIRFDWAIKRILRDKANFGILEGFLTELIGEEIKVEAVLESESNQEQEGAKFNRVDLLVENAKGELILIEVQNSHELDYFLRILFGISKVVTEYVKSGDPYSKVKKVISVNIVYFDLGQGEDYLYKGKTTFKGVHKNDVLELSPGQKKLFKKEKVEELFPEIYLIKVNQFDDLAKNSLDEWIYFFKNSEIKKDFNAKGLKEADEKLRIINMDEQEYKAYQKYLDDLMYQASLAETARFMTEEQVRKEEKVSIAKIMLAENESIEKIMLYTSLSREEIEKLARQ